MPTKLIPRKRVELMNLLLKGRKENQRFNHGVCAFVGAAGRAAIIRDGVASRFRVCVPWERIIIVIQMAGFEYNAHCSRRAPGNILRAEYKILRAAAACHSEREKTAQSLFLYLCMPCELRKDLEKPF